jgi:uncharacterized protein
VIYEDLKKDLYSAMKEKDAFKSGVLRYLISHIKNKEIELRTEGRELIDEDILKVIKKQIKQRNQSIEQYEKAGRRESVESETRELKLLEQYYSKYSNE